MKTKTLIKIFGLCFFYLPIYGQTFQLSNFKETKIPKYSSQEWHTVQQSKNAFTVYKQNGVLMIKKYEYKSMSELQIHNGKLIGIDKGEWGGNLIFVPNDTTKKQIEIAEGNIQYIFNFHDNIYIIDGLAHMSMSSGTLNRLDIDKDSFNYKTIIEFEDAPEAYTIYKDLIFIASYKNFYIIKDFKKDIIFADEFWESLYPNSIVYIDKTHIYVGIRGGYVQLDIINKVVKFFKYNG